MSKSKAAKFLKKILASMAKAKTLALKARINALRTRLMMFSLLREKKLLMTSISQKLRALVAHQPEHHKQENEDGITIEDQGRAIVLNNHSSMSLLDPTQRELLANLADDDGERDNGYGYVYEDDEDEKFPDLIHSLFDSEDVEYEDPGGSVKNSKKEGEEFRLEDEIDRVVDLFIKRFHRQMRMQNQEVSRNA